MVDAHGVRWGNSGCSSRAHSWALEALQGSEGGEAGFVCPVGDRTGRCVRSPGVLVLSLLLFVALLVSFCQLLGVLSLNVTSSLVTLCSVVASSAALIPTPCPGPS